MNATEYGPWALIAGGSEGIGASFARKLAGDGINLVLVARKSGPLEALAKEIRDDTGATVRTLSLDMLVPDALEKVRAITDELEIGLFIHNAGAAEKFANFLDDPFDSWWRLISLNVVGQAAFAHHYGRLMKARGRGGIILMGSIAGCCGAGDFAVYAASKAFSHVFAQGLWEELRPYGVHVLGLVAGSTRTPAMERMGTPMNHPLLPTVEADLVAEEGLAHLADGPIHLVSGQEETFRYLTSLPPKEAVTLVSDSTRKIFGRA